MKKFISTIVMGALLMAAIPVVPAVVPGTSLVANAEYAVKGAGFADVSAVHPNIKAIEYFQNEDIVVGYEDGTFGEDRNITRAEFLKIVVEAAEMDVQSLEDFDLEAAGDYCFSDVEDHWARAYICLGEKADIVDGYEDGTFKPDSEINFAEASKIVVNTLFDLLDEDLQNNLSVGPHDEGLFENWFELYVEALEAEEAIPAEVDAFDDKLTRSQMAEMSWRIKEGRTYRVSNTYENIKEGKPVQELGGPLTTFEDCKELQTYIEDNAERYYYYDDVVMMEGAFEGEESFDDAGVSADEPAGLAAPEAAPMVDSQAKSVEADYSTTNVQVEGVDEADIAKTDGENVYVVSGGSVQVVSAYPPENMELKDAVTFDDTGFWPSEMFVDGDRLVIIGTAYGSLQSELVDDAEMVIEPYYYYSDETKVYIFDITDASNIELLRQLSFEGSYSSSRKVDGTVYLVANQYMSYWPWVEDKWTDDDLVPLYYDSAVGKTGQLVGCGEVKYMPGVVDTTDYIITAAIPVDDPKAAIDEQVVMGYSGAIYSSRDNLYVAEPKYSWTSWDGWGDGDNEETFIHRFALDGANIEYSGVGTVPGTILNQFSMDENGDYFRIATTSSGKDWVNKNNLYVMDKDLKVVGSVEGLAQGESIYSVRFVGDRAYMVTFERVDPLFVIGLEDPTNPVVLGELKIPGFSDYLHPFDEDHLIGFGMDAVSVEDEMWGDFVWTQGIKMVLFDVSDPSNPRELHRAVIGDRGTTSLLNNTHKALLFDKGKGLEDGKALMAFPVNEAKIPDDWSKYTDVPDQAYGEFVFQGAYVYDVSTENGFELRGKVSHYADGEVEALGGQYWWDANDDIERLLYIGDYLYSVSDSSVMASALTDLTEVGRVKWEETYFGNMWDYMVEPMPVEVF